MPQSTISSLRRATFGIVLAAFAAGFASAWLLPTSSLPVKTRSSSGKGGLTSPKKSSPLEPLLSVLDDNENNIPVSQSNQSAEPDEPPSLTDDELLLACRAYLQKKKKLGKWSMSEKRKAARKRQRDFSRESLTGFFWEDPTELKYYRHNINSSVASLSSRHLKDEALMNVLDDETEVDTEDEEEEDGVESSPRITTTSQVEQVSFEFPGRDENDNLEQAAREFSAFPTQPSESRIRRTESAKRRWENSEWKAGWYKQRWGSRTKKVRKKSGLKERLEVLTVDFLSSQEFLNLTEAEVNEAAEQYATANHKRAISRKKALKERRAALEPPRSETPIPLDSLSWNRDPKALEEARRQRSERSRKAYQTRVINSNKTAATLAPKKAKPKRVPKGDTPQDALLRVEADLDQGKLPIIRDLELICGPRKLAKRKELLKKLLLEHYDLRGKCVPVGGDHNNLQFVTSCPIDDLAAFVLDTVRRNNQNNKHKQT